MNEITNASTSSEAAAVNHLICARSAPCARRKRTTIDAAAASVEANQRTSPMASRASCGKPSMPSGLSTQRKFSSGPGAKKAPMISAAPPASPVQRTIRQRGVGGRPVGKWSGSSTRTMITAGTQETLASQRPSSAAAPGDRGSWLAAYQ